MDRFAARPRFTCVHGVYTFIPAGTNSRTRKWTRHPKPSVWGRFGELPGSNPLAWKPLNTPNTRKPEILVPHLPRVSRLTPWEAFHSRRHGRIMNPSGSPGKASPKRVAIIPGYRPQAFNQSPLGKWRQNHGGQNFVLHDFVSQAPSSSGNVRRRSTSRYDALNLLAGARRCSYRDI